MKVAVAGSSGLIGEALVTALDAGGHEVLRLVRPSSNVAGVGWDPAAGVIDAASLEGVDAVVNLAGRSIGDRRWTDAEKRHLTSSRIDSTLLLAGAISELDRKPQVLLNASAIGYYGDRADEDLTEEKEAGSGFFPELCGAWEASTSAAEAAGVRVVHLRSGLVLAPAGGALGRLLAPFGPAWLSPYRWGLGGWLGSGKQWWSWISLRDEIRAILHLLESDIAGPVNLTSPSPSRNKGFMKAVGGALRRPIWLPIPRFVLRIVLGTELAQATLFDSQRVLPSRLQADGFVFEDDDLDLALDSAIGPHKT